MCARARARTTVWGGESVGEPFGNQQAVRSPWLAGADDTRLSVRSVGPNPVMRMDGGDEDGMPMQIHSGSNRNRIPNEMT